MFQRNVQVAALSRTSAHKAPAHLKHHCVDLDQDEQLPQIHGQGILSFPPQTEGQQDLRMRGLLPRLGPIDRLVYISTSGVYGDCAGEWVDETRQPAPITARARRRLDAENQLQQWAQTTGCRLSILRVPGIYGPGRLPLARLQRQDPVLQPDQAPWSNRIHSEDLANAVLLALDKGEGIYNISDGNPDSMSQYFLRCAQLLGLPTPPLIDRSQAEASFSPALLSYYRESRRLDIGKARRELGFEPQYPTLEAGLPSCLD